MSKSVTLTLSPKQAADNDLCISLCAKRLNIAQTQIALARITHRSIDARGGGIKVNLTYEVFVDTDAKPDEIHFDYPTVDNAPQVVIIGSGPAGLFAALRLIELGFKPLILERGKEVSLRKRDIALLNRDTTLDPDSNYAFGEGGAGTFSDGKLFTRSKKRGDSSRALQTLVFHGASPQILYEAHPHIGSDRLPTIISAIRRTITGCGGEILFDSRVTGFTLADGKITRIECGSERIDTQTVVLATGHSARDIYCSLAQAGIRLEAKAFAAGVRVEHPQELIDAIQYHGRQRGEWLPAASYSLVTQVAGRGVYSFCMCPGGFIVPAMTEAGRSVVNGMSPSLRNSPYANAGIVTEVRTSDFEYLRPQFGELAGLEFQRRIEQAAHERIDSVAGAPAQRLTDFLSARRSASLPDCSYLPRRIEADINTILPRFMAEALRGGFTDFGRKMRGFVTAEAQILGLESRTSTPVRIPRMETTLAHPQVSNLYPAGEGAGYAGGIVSAAIDGTRVAEAVAASMK